MQGLGAWSESSVSPSSVVESKLARGTFENNSATFGLFTVELRDSAGPSFRRTLFLSVWGVLSEDSDSQRLGSLGGLFTNMSGI